LLAAGLFERGLAAGHWPLTNRYEFALCYTWTVITIYLLSEISWHEWRAGVFVLVIALLAMTYAVTRPAPEQAIAPLLPALRSVWLQVHVLTALVGYGAFGVAAGWGLARLLQPPQATCMPPVVCVAATAAKAKKARGKKSRATTSRASGGASR